jgi:NAD(P)-dependent dehydrogenase (short-subunit alcohol dehydrogenase family)
VLVAGRNAARLRAVAAETGGIAIEADLAAPDGAEALAVAAMQAAATWDADPAGETAGPLGVRSLNATAPLPRPSAGSHSSSDGGLRAQVVMATRPPQVTDLASRPGPPDLPAAPKPPVVPPLPMAGGGIDILINNAGVGWAGPLTDMSAATVAQLVAVNLTAPIELTRLLTPTLAAGGRGRVVFVSSIAGQTGAPQEAVYAATKAGLNYFAESLRYELAGTGVGVSVVVPGVIDTPFFAQRGRPYSRRRPVPISAQRVGRAVLMAIEREQPVAFVPRWLRFPAWLHGAAPGIFRALAARFG